MVFFFAVLASTIALPIYLGVNWMSIVIVLGDAGILFVIVRHYRKKRAHLKRFEAWSTRKESLYGS